ncbi:MAG: cadmium-translocating P-type ATPase [Bacteroidales bacterium]|nr:cadmium-translocating P-type ATPase [Bacteroidales bacterium]
MKRKQKKMLARIIVASVLTLILQIVDLQGWFRLLAFFGVYLIIGYDILLKAFKGIGNRRVFDENFLMFVATVGAFSLAIYEKSGDYMEAIAVMLFYQVGEFFQSYAIGKSRKNISALMDIRPDYANIEQEGEIVKVDPEEISIGQIIIVQPGEKVPIDGVVVEGKSSLNSSALTGESLPKEIGEGEEIISGCINMTGVLKVRTTKEFGESTVSKVLMLVEESSVNKSKSEDFIAKFARVYTPAVCYSALALALLPPLVQMLFLGAEAEWSVWIYRALTFLVISCPCALVVSIPLTFFAGIGGASREGILIKGANMLETLSKIKKVVFDKTGTLTLGVFEVNAIHDDHDHNNTNEEERNHLIELAAIVESFSSHPISKSLQKAYGKVVDHSRVRNIEEKSGYGITAYVDDDLVSVGNDKLMKTIGVEYCQCHTTGTIIHIAINNKYAGHIVLGDVLKPHSAQAIERLHNMGIKETIMLTGDAKPVAEQVAKSLGMDKVYSELLPDGKVKMVESFLQQSTRKEKLAFVGDGINDAPVLSRADIGIAMGGMGSDAAIEAADVVLMDDEPMKISKAIRIAKKCMGIVWQNIILALGVKVLCLILGAFGIANMWLAIFADVGIMIIAVLNAIRALYVRKL